MLCCVLFGDGSIRGTFAHRAISSNKKNFFGKRKSSFPSFGHLVHSHINLDILATCSNESTYSIFWIFGKIEFFNNNNNISNKIYFLLYKLCTLDFYGPYKIRTHRFPDWDVNSLNSYRHKQYYSVSR